MKNNIRKADNVFVTNDYKIFKFLKINRDVKSSRVKPIEKSILFFVKLLGCDLAFLGSIVTFKRKEDGKDVYYVLEGQGRIETLRKINASIPVTFQVIDIKDKDIKECIIMINSASKNWGTTDCIESHIKSENPNLSKTYSKLNELKQKHGITWGLITQLILGVKDMKKLKDGKISVPSGLEKRIKQLLDYKEFGIEINMYQRHVVDVINLPNYNHERMLNKIRREGGVPQGNEKKLRKFLNNVCGNQLVKMEEQRSKLAA